jgi:hypothetical protein
MQKPRRHKEEGRNVLGQKVRGRTALEGKRKRKEEGGRKEKR